MERSLVRIPFGDACFSNEITYLDIETQKVPILPVRMRNGEFLNRRWNPIMIGTGFCFEGELYAQVEFGWPSPNDWVTNDIPAGNTILYSATREFDEMVLKGLFSTARRSHFDTVPDGWPALVRSHKWECIVAEKFPGRAFDIKSKDIRDVDWANRTQALEDVVIIHCLRDVVELFLTRNDLPLGTVNNIASFLHSNTVALRLIEDNDDKAE